MNRSIEGLQRLRKRGGYLEPKDCITAREEFLRQANPLPRFLASDSCAISLGALRQHIEAKYLAELTVAEGQPKLLASIRESIAIDAAQAENGGLRQTMTEFYKCFWQWCRNEGIQQEKLRKMDVENHLANLGYAIATVHGQKWVVGVIAFDPGDHRPPNAM